MHNQAQLEWSLSKQLCLSPFMFDQPPPLAPQPGGIPAQHGAFSSFSVYQPLSPSPPTVCSTCLLEAAGSSGCTIATEPITASTIYGPLNKCYLSLSISQIPGFSVQQGDRLHALCREKMKLTQPSFPPHIHTTWGGSFFAALYSSLMSICKGTLQCISFMP